MSFHTPEQDADGLKPHAGGTQGLPEVLLVGDSISGGYTTPVREMLRGVCNVHRPDANCGDTRRGLAELDSWLGPRDWDLVHFNWGLHDLCYRHPDSQVYGNRDKIKGTIAVEPDEYGENLEQLVQMLKKRARLLVWASTTYVPEGEAGRFQGDDVRYNAIAARIMRRHAIPTNDLHTLTASFAPELFTCAGDVHYTKDGYSAIARGVAGCIEGQLKGAGMH